MEIYPKDKAHSENTKINKKKRRNATWMMMNLN